MTGTEQKRISKFLSYVLRHSPESIGVELDSAGWVDVSTLLDAINECDKPLTQEQLEQIVSENPKRRFEFSEDQMLIRARQGHSITVDLGLDPMAPPTQLFHGTTQHVLASIRTQGLVRGQRHHVHLSADKATAKLVGGRRGKPVVLTVDAASMGNAGHVFYLTSNSVWLIDHVPPEYLSGLDFE